MSSTNKTPNYDLSQFVGTDKPTYLGDYNGDMLKIDTQMKENNDAATSAQTSAGEALAKATQAQNDVEGLNSRVGTVETSVTQLQNTVTSQGQNITSVTGVANSANDLANKLDDDIDEWLKYTQNSTTVGTLTSSGFTVYINKKLNLAIFSSEIDNLNNVINTDEAIITLPENMRPKTQRLLRNCLNLRDVTNNKVAAIISCNLNTDGTLTLYSQFTRESSSSRYDAFIQHCYCCMDWF